MKAENLNVGDRVSVPAVQKLLTISAILPPLLYPGYLTLTFWELAGELHIPVDRELLLIGTIPVLS